MKRTKENCWWLQEEISSLKVTIFSTLGYLIQIYPLTTYWCTYFCIAREAGFERENSVCVFYQSFNGCQYFEVTISYWKAIPMRQTSFEVECSVLATQIQILDSSTGTLLSTALDSLMSTSKTSSLHLRNLTGSTNSRISPCPSQPSCCVVCFETAYYHLWT